MPVFIINQQPYFQRYLLLLQLHFDANGDLWECHTLYLIYTTSQVPILHLFL
jgi:hypothetical protein